MWYYFSITLFLLNNFLMPTDNKENEVGRQQASTEVAATIVDAHKSFSPKFLPAEHHAENCHVCRFPLDGIVELLKTSCGHYFHTKCLQKNSDRGDHVCPHCRSRIGNIQNGVELAIEQSAEEKAQQEKKQEAKMEAAANEEKGVVRGNGYTYQDLPEEHKMDSCAICDGLFSRANDDLESGEFYQTTCNHYFHTDCLTQLQNSGNFNCPICNTKIGMVTPLKPAAKNVVFDSVAFEKVQLKSFIDFIADLKQMSYIPNNDAAAVETSLSVREPLTADQAYNVFLSVLEMAGFSHIKVGDVYKIVKKDAKFAEPLPIFVGRPSKELPDSDRTIRFVTFLKNLSVGDVDALLKSLLSPGAQQIQLPNLNGIVISDRCANIKSAMRVINELDNAGYQEMVSLVKLKETNASEVKAFLEQIMKKPDGSAVFRLLSGAIEGGVEYFPQGIKIIADDRTNTLILLGMRHALKRVEDFIISFVDKGLQALENPLHIYECQYMDATSIKQIVDAVTASSSDSVASKFGGIRGGLKYFGQVTTEADQLGNRIIVACSDKKDWEMLHKLLVDLDKPQPQVSIETLMVEIENTDNKNLGGQIRNRNADSPIPGVNFRAANSGSSANSASNFVDLLTNLVSSGTQLAQGSTLIAFGPASNVWAILQALSMQTKVSVISKPCITVANRAEGRVEIGTTSKIIGDEAISPNGGISTYGYQDATAKTIVAYTPQINQEGLVTLKVAIDIQEFGADANSKTSKNLATNVTVADGQVMVMGGFVKTKASEASQKTPVFSSIPILGWFFKGKQRTMQKTYTFFFVVTNIIKPRKTPGMGLYTKMKLHDAYKTMGDTVEMVWGKDPVHNHFFNPEKEEYAHKIVDFANARYQPTTVDLQNDSYYESITNANMMETKKEISSQKRDKELVTQGAEISQRVLRHVPANGIAEERDASSIKFLKPKEETLRQLLDDNVAEIALTTNKGNEEVVLNKKPTLKTENLAEKSVATNRGMDSVGGGLPLRQVPFQASTAIMVGSKANDKMVKDEKPKEGNKSIAEKRQALLALLQDESLDIAVAQPAPDLWRAGQMRQARKEMLDFIKKEEREAAENEAKHQFATSLLSEEEAPVKPALKVAFGKKADAGQDLAKNDASKMPQAKKHFGDFLASSDEAGRRLQSLPDKQVITAGPAFDYVDDKVALVKGKEDLLQALLAEQAERQVQQMDSQIETAVELPARSKAQMLRELFAQDEDGASC